MRLALGTVQFGLNYGVANHDGQVSLEQAKKIIQIARENYFDTIDTAIAYGDSEARLGKIGVSDFKVVTKLPEIPSSRIDDPEWLRSHVEASLERLRIDRLYGLLLHRSNQLVGSIGKSIRSVLVSLKKDGLVEKIGVSIYSQNELDSVIQSMNLDLIQVPINLIDRRLIDSGWLVRLKRLGIEVHARSAFLQGLLLMEKEQIPDKFSQWSSLWEQWQDWLAVQSDCGAADAALGYLESIKEIDRVVVGVDSVEQLRGLIKSQRNHTCADWPNISSTDEMLVNPSNWSLL